MDVSGRGAAGGFPPAAAELEDPFAAPVFFPMVVAAELSAFSLWVEELMAMVAGANEQGEEKNLQVLNIYDSAEQSWPPDPEQ